MKEEYTAHILYENFRPVWSVEAAGREICRISFDTDSGLRTATVCCALPELSGVYVCTYDRDQTLVPGIRRRICAAGSGEVAGELRFTDFTRASINGRLWAELDGLQIDYYLAGEEKTHVGRCFLYDDVETLKLRISPREANWFTLTCTEKLEPLDLLMTMLYPVLGFV